MKIVYVITRPERGGAQSHLLELLRGLPDPLQALLVSGVDLDLFLVEEARALGIRTEFLPTLVPPISPLNDLRAVWALYRIFRRERPALVHAHSSKAGLLARIAARLAGLPSVFTAHGWAFTEGAGWGRRALALGLERLAARLGTRIIAVSEYDRSLGLRLGVGRTDRVVTIHNALCDGDPLLSTSNQAGQPFRVAMVARFAPPKDQALLLRAAAQVPEVQVVFLGDGPRRAEAQALATSLGSNAEFLGSRSDVPKVLAGCHAFALVSNFEGFPISTLEGMRAALPVIVSEVGGAAEALQGGPEGVGLTVPRGDLEALVTALRTLADNPQRAARMGRAARALFLERFTVPQMLERTWAVYESAQRAGAEASDTETPTFAD